MKILVLCRPGEGVDPATEIVPRVGEELAALRELCEEGIVAEAYSPGGPGAVLICQVGRVEVERALRRLPLVREGIVVAELIELHPFPSLGA